MKRHFGEGWSLRLRSLTVVAVLCAARAHGADLVVRATGDLVTIHAEAAPLPDLLEALSRETGLRVVWGLDPAPRPLVTLAVSGQPQSDAVAAIFEGLRFSYALGLDPTGRRVRELHIVGATPPPPAVGEAVHWPPPWRPLRVKKLREGTDTYGVLKPQRGSEG